MYLADIYTVPVSLAGLPAMSVPCGFANNLPVAMQLVAKQFNEEQIFQTAYAYEQANAWQKLKPKL